MDTNELIQTLATNARPRAVSFSATWWGGAAIAAAIAAGVFLATLGPRPDIAIALGTVRFLFKLVVTGTLAATAFAFVRMLSQPGEPWRRVLPYLAAAPALLAGAVMAELIVLPPEAWQAAMIGTNSRVCLVYVPLIGIGPLAVFMFVLRHGAPTRPALAGAAAGLAAGGLAAAFYAAHCPDDSPLFLAAWYTIAIAGLAFLGAAAANRLARW
ncbi:NrsF family protein [Rhodoligotrophos defluvii]|uniref:NrsF family protein n=1 Tax=Rhodoligotrophos defluvii TaxID=2561934 RepID=UPI0010C9CE19|nr:NrsF family protein [Rhodoligotrophos defluvii]